MWLARENYFAFRNDPKPHINEKVKTRVQDAVNNDLSDDGTKDLGTAEKIENLSEVRLGNNGPMIALLTHTTHNPST